MSQLSVDVGQFTHRITVRIRGMRVWSWRLAIAARVFALGGWIAGVNLEMDLPE